jgi:TetR/AcrR family transcriptional regulator
MLGTSVDGLSMTKSAPRTRIQEKNRSTILEAGLDVFSQFGFRGSTVDQIAEAAGLSKPNLLYYFPSKEAIYLELLNSLLDTWLDPLRALNDDGKALPEILDYVRRKLAMARDFPRESRLFAGEILQGAPRIEDALKGDLKTLVDEKAEVIRHWITAGKIKEVDPYHLIFSIWALTQHYADFDTQVRAVLGGQDPFPGAEHYLEQLFTSLLKP